MKLELNMAVCGQGALTPNGTGVSSLLSREPWKTTQTASAGNPGSSHPTFRVDLGSDPLKRWQMEPRLRRASPIALYMAEAASQAMAGLGDAPRDRVGIVAALFTGSLAFSQRFFQDVITDGQKFASPAIFPETVFNSPLSHLASILNIPGACYAIVGDESAWVTAILAAAAWLRSGSMDHVLVVGAEEMAPIALNAYAASGWFHPGRSFIPSEGAGALLLRSAKNGDRLIIRTAADGFTYRSRREAASAATACMEMSPVKLPVFHSAQHNWMASLETKATASRKSLPDEQLPYCGEAFTASAAWHTLRAISLLGDAHPGILQPVWGQTQQISSLELSIRRD